MTLSLCNKNIKTIKISNDLNLNRLGHMIQSNKDKICFRILDIIDNYSLTIFNQIQIGVVLDDLNKLKNLLNDKDEIEYLEKVYDFIESAKEKPHQYIKLTGD